jgi:eukaryotic-like serine/threonine-protein kinase
MALVNCAGLIAQHLPSNAKPILLIDFDLEAPGLHRYLTPYLSPADVCTPRVGVLELFEALRKAVEEKLEQHSSGVQGNERRLEDEVTVEIIDGFDFTPFITDTTVTGLQLMMAGRFDDSYAERLTRFNWEQLFNNAPGLFRCLSDRLAREHSFTFVDSRTGLSDTSGICTMLLPDVLILVFTPNNQSLTGIEHLVRKAANYRANASDSRKLRAYPLPSRVDNQVEHFRHVWRMGDPQHPLFGTVLGYQPMFEKVFNSVLEIGGADALEHLTDYFDVVQVPHSADYSYGERLCFALTSPNDSLSIRGSYEQFLPWLATGAQPWQNPAELLLNQQAVLWLREAGVDDLPTSPDGWFSWFERLSKVLDNLQHPVVLQQPVLSAELRFDTSMVLALASAHRGDFRAANEYLQRAISSYGEDISSIVPMSAPKQLLAFWSESLPVQDLCETERRDFIEILDRVMKTSQPLRRERQAWLASLSGLARKSAWYSMARAALEELVVLNRDGVGEEHPDTLTSMNNLASTLWDQGDLNGARQLQEKVLEVRRRTLGEEHPNTLTSMNNLASTLRDQGDLNGARQLQEKVLEVSRRTLGEEHPNTLTSMNNLARTLQDIGDLSGAYELYKQGRAGLQRVLGNEHRDTWAAGMTLSTVAVELGEPSEAARVLDAFKSPALTTDNAQWLGLRLKVAEKLGEREDISRYQRRLLDLLRKTPLV